MATSLYIVGFLPKIDFKIQKTEFGHSTNYQNDASQRKNRVYHHPDEDLRHDVWAQSDIQLVSPRFPQHSGTHALFGELFRVAGEADTRQPPPIESDV